MSDSPEQPTVAIAGGGMAGLTAAYYLAKRGYKVTLYETTDRVGGALSAVHGGADFSDQGVNFECSPHMFGDWYNNFFALMREVGVDKSESFQFCPKIGFLQRGEPLKYRWLVNNGSIPDGFKNLFSGVDTPANLFLYWYTIIDILTQDFSDFSQLGNVGDTMSLNGYVITRPWTPERVALFLQEAMVNIWAVDSFLTSIAAFASSARYQAKSPTPTAWITTQSNSYDLIVVPLKKKLEELGVRIEVNTTVLGVTVEATPPNPAKVTRLALQYGAQPEGPGTPPKISTTTVEVDHFIMAVPRFAMAPLIGLSAGASLAGRIGPQQHTPPEGPGIGSNDQALGEPTPPKADLSSLEHSTAADLPRLVLTAPPTIVEYIPELAGADVEGVPLAMLYVPFNKELPDIPLGYVGLSGSEGSLTFINVPYLARRLGAKMVLAIGISKFGGLPAAVDAEGMQDIHRMKDPAAAAIARQIMNEFRHFVSFEEKDIIFDKVVLKTNTHHKLFLNTVGSMLSAPNTHYDRITNLFFAVETRENPVQIATVEGAVIGGLQAAQALWARNPASDNNKNNPVVPIMPTEYSQAELWAMKIGLFPWAVVAKFWSDAEASYVRSSRVGAANALANGAVQFVTAPFWFGLNTIRLLRAIGMAR